MNVTIRDWTFTHFWVRPTVKVWFDFYHKSVTYSGEENIDWEKPIIFAASHQSAFTDALCLILPTRYTNDRFIYPLVRADAFGNSRVADWILTSFHMMPVYRPKDKVDIKKRNDSVFADCHKILSKNRNLLIHPEGNCFPIKKVRRFKKGLARIAFGAEMVNGFDLDTVIIPVGINYRRNTGARGGIHIRYGEPIELTHYEEAYRSHKAAAIAELTSEVEERVREITVDIQLDAKYELIEDIIDLGKKLNRDFAFHKEYSLQEFEYDKMLVSKAEAALQEQETKADSLSQTVQQVHSLIEEQKLDPGHSLVNTYSTLRLAAGGVGYLVMLPFFIYGWVNNILPWYLIHKLADRIEDGQFVNSARMVLGLLTFPLFYIAQSLIFWFITGSGLWAMIYFFSLPISGIVSLKLFENWKEWRQQLKLRIMSPQAGQKLTELKDTFFRKLGIRS